MNRADWLRAQRVRPTAVWTQYKLAKTRHPDALFAFVEGKDDASFYLPELRRRWLRGEVQPMTCEGKAGVLDILSRLTADSNCREAPERSLFFCDKDLDNFIGLAPPSSPALFVTKAYSIENYVVTEEVLRQAWTDLFKLPASDHRLPTEAGDFISGLRRFQSMMRPLMAWVMFHRESGHRLFLNQVNMDQLVKVSSDYRPTWRTKNIGATLRKMCPEAVPVSAPCLFRLAKKFRGHEPKSYVRGKFELWFFAKCLNTCLQRLAGAPAGQRPSCKVTISEANAIDTLYGRGRIPKELDSFLHNALPANVRAFI
jgi:hypothetical protein